MGKEVVGAWKAEVEPLGLSELFICRVQERSGYKKGQGLGCGVLRDQDIELA